MTALVVSSGDRSLLDEMSTDLSDFGAQDLANVAWAMAVQLVTTEPLVVAVAMEAQRKLPAMGPQHLCNLIWAFATISWSTPGEPGDRSNLILSLSNEVRQRSSELENLGLAAASWGFATAVAARGAPQHTKNVRGATGRVSVMGCKKQADPS
eukprot:s76_g14.t1